MNFEAPRCLFFKLLQRMYFIIIYPSFCRMNYSSFCKPKIRNCKAWIFIGIGLTILVTSWQASCVPKKQIKYRFIRSKSAKFYMLKCLSRSNNWQNCCFFWAFFTFKCFLTCCLPQSKTAIARFKTRLIIDKIIVFLCFFILFFYFFL